MKVLWSKLIKIRDLWTPECFGLFSKHQQIITFFFKHRDQLLSISKEETAPQLLYCNDTLPLPYQWLAVETSNASFILVSEDRGFNLRNDTFSCDIPTQLRMVYRKHIHHDKYYEEASYSLGELTIQHRGDYGYICNQGDIVLWKFTGRAYLYTDMIRWKNRLIFGTGGNGGYFYVLDILNGTPLFTIKTGGTRSFIHINNLCYVLNNEKTAQLLCIDISNGKIVSKCDLPGVATIDSRITLIDNCIHVITFSRLHSKENGFIWSCVNMGQGDGLREP